MFIWSITLTKEKIALLLAVLLIFTLIAGICVTYLQEDSLRTNTGRIRLLARCGLSSDSSPVSVQSFKIPQEFDAFFREYEALQQKQGLSLLPYCKKTVKKYTYLVSEADQKPLYANLFIKNGTLIACDLTCPDLTEGFVKPLLLHTKTAQEENSL